VVEFAAMTLAPFAREWGYLASFIDRWDLQWCFREST